MTNDILMPLASPDFLPQTIFDTLKKREQMLIVLLYENKHKKYSKSKLMEKLLIDNVRTFDRLRKRVSEIIKRHIVTK